MGLFTPAWMKGESQALKAAKNAEGSAKLHRIIMESPYPEAREAALDKLRFLDKVEHVVERIRDIAEHGQSAFDRCWAATMLPKRDDARPYIARNIVEAYADPFVTKTWRYYTAAEWIRYISDNETELLVAAVDAACGLQHGKLQDDFVVDIIENLHNPFALMRIAEHDVGSRSRQKVQEQLSKTPVHGDAEEMLADAARKGNEVAARRLVERSPSKYAPLYPEQLTERDYAQLGVESETLLVKLADDGNRFAAKRLLTINLHAYADRYPDRMDGGQARSAIRSGSLSQRSLGVVARRWLDSSGLEGVSGEALKHITDEDVLADLLSTQATGTYNWRSNEKIKGWFYYLVEQLMFRPDVLADYLLSDAPTAYGAQGYAFSLIEDAPTLARIAMTDTWMAEKAVERLGQAYDPVHEMQVVAERAVSSKVRTIAQRWLYRLQLETSVMSDDEILAIVEWSKRYDFGAFEELQAVALDKLQGQQARLEALGSVRTAEASGVLLPRITDAQGLAEVCLSVDPNFDSERPFGMSCACRLAKLAHGAPEGDAFVAKLSHVMQTEDPLGVDARRALLLLTAYEDVSEAQAALAYGGEAHIRLLMDEIKRSGGELGRTDQAARRLSAMYALGSPQSPIARLNGTTHKKHVDWVSSTCGSDRCDTVVTYTFEL